MSESHVARVAPHSHFPPNDAYRYPGAQFSGYAPHMKYSDSAETSQSNPMSTSVIQKPKAKEYMEMCNVQQSHLNNQQYSPEGVQYSKDPYQYKMAVHKDPTQVIKELLHLFKLHIVSEFSGLPEHVQTGISVLPERTTSVPTGGPPYRSQIQPHNEPKHEEIQSCAGRQSLLEQTEQVASQHGQIDNQ